MIALVVGIVVVRILDDTGTTVTGLANTLDEITDDGKFRLIKGFITGVTDNSHRPGSVIEEELIEMLDGFTPPIDA
jgi:hypothetical protein